MKTNILKLIIILFIVLLYSCEKDKKNTGIGDEFDTIPGTASIEGTVIAGYETAKEVILRNIPAEYINTARNTLHVAYQHTSHGTHVAYGLYGLQDYKDGDDILFGITNNNPTTGKLDFRDYAMASYGENASDLSNNETAFIQATRNYLDDPDNKDINVVMWSWCDISTHDVSNNYIPGMQTLINEYSAGGSKIGTGDGQREIPVTFIFMTGHATGGLNIGDGRPANQADIIISYCEEHGYLCLDYYSIDTHDMDDNYWMDTNDDGSSDLYGGNFYIDWQNNHTESSGYYYNKDNPNGNIVFGQHNTQHITANRKAYAMWYILARIAGWDGEI